MSEKPALNPVARHVRSRSVSALPGVTELLAEGLVEGMSSWVNCRGAGERSSWNPGVQSLTAEFEYSWCSKS